MSKPDVSRLLRRRLLRALAGAPVAAALADVLAKGEIPIRPGFNRLRGSVTLNGRPAELGMRVSAGDRIVTGRGAEAIYVLGADAFLQRESTEVRLGDTAAEFMRLVTGRLLSVFGRGEKTLVTAVSTIGIRGTGCYIESEPGREYFCLCYGEAEVRLAADPGRRQTIRTEYHDYPVELRPEAGERWAAPAKVVNHTDAELTLLESLVGRLPPFHGRSDAKY